MQIFFIPIRLPGMNEILKASSQVFLSNKGVRAGNNYGSMKSRLSTKILKILLEEKIKPVEAATFDFTWVEPNKKRDPDNIAAGVKVILDALVKGKIIPNDGWQHNKGWTNTFMIGKGEYVGVRVRIHEVDVNKKATQEELF